MAEFDCRAFMASVRREAGERRPPLAGWSTVSALLRMSGADFLVAAYRAMLGREPDPDGMRSYLPRSLRLPGRVRILLALFFSPEQTWMPSALRRVVTCLRGRRRRRGGEGGCVCGR